MKKLPYSNSVLSRISCIFLSSLLLFCSACSTQGVLAKDPDLGVRDSGLHRAVLTDESEVAYTRANLSPAAGAAAGVAPKAIGYAVLYYIPNRILDLIDIFRADVGIGVSYGAVVRLTRYGQVGYRGFSPRSFRIGIRGRRSPIFLERYPEYGIGPGFRNTGARLPSTYEIGAGADALLVGAYAGLSLDELLDFLGGLVFIDFKRDDLNFR